MTMILANRISPSRVVRIIVGNAAIIAVYAIRDLPIELIGIATALLVFNAFFMMFSTFYMLNALERTAWFAFWYVTIVATSAVARVIMAYAFAYRAFGLIDTMDNSVTTDRIPCIYFSLVTFTTLGYGDFRPVPAARLVAASEALFGYIMLAFFIAAFQRFYTRYFPSPDPTGHQPADASKN
jgi:hypothetical protein